MSISYAEIPADNLEPIFATEFDGSNASKGGPMPWKNLIIGQPLASKMATNGTLTKVTSDEQADADYGYGSQLALMIHAFRKNSKTSELWVLPIADDNSSAAATVTLTFAVADSTNGLAANGTIRLMIAGQSCAVNVAAGDKANDVAAKVAAAIGAVGTVGAPNTKNYPVTASASSAVVTLTAKNKGTCGNGLDVRWNYYQGEKLDMTGLKVRIYGPDGYLDSKDGKYLSYYEGTLDNLGERKINLKYEDAKTPIYVTVIEVPKPSETTPPTTEAPTETTVPPTTEAPTETTVPPTTEAPTEPSEAPTEPAEPQGNNGVKIAAIAGGSAVAVAGIGAYVFLKMKGLIK